MDNKYKYIIVFLLKIFVLRQVSADIYSVKIGTEQHVNVVDSRFLSFTVDPKYLFTSDEKYNRWVDNNYLIILRIRLDFFNVNLSPWQILLDLH